MINEWSISPFSHTSWFGSHRRPLCWSHMAPCHWSSVQVCHYQQFLFTQITCSESESKGKDETFRNQSTKNRQHVIVIGIKFRNQLNTRRVQFKTGCFPTAPKQAFILSTEQTELYIKLHHMKKSVSAKLALQKLNHSENISKYTYHHYTHSDSTKFFNFPNPELSHSTNPVAILYFMCPHVNPCRAPSTGTSNDSSTDLPDSVYIWAVKPNQSSCAALQPAQQPNSETERRGNRKVS